MTDMTTATTSTHLDHHLDNRHDCLTTHTSIERRIPFSESSSFTVGADTSKAARFTCNGENEPCNDNQTPVKGTRILALPGEDGLTLRPSLPPWHL